MNLTQCYLHKYFKKCYKGASIVTQRVKPLHVVTTYDMGAPVQTPAIPLLIKLPADASEKVAEMGPLPGSPQPTWKT